MVFRVFLLPAVLFVTVHSIVAVWVLQVPKLGKDGPSVCFTTFCNHCCTDLRIQEQAANVTDRIEEAAGPPQRDRNGQPLYE